MEQIYKKDIKLLLVTAVLILSTFIFFVSDIPNTQSSEVGFSSFSPSGKFGGEVIPASCESGYDDSSKTYTYGASGTCQPTVSISINPNPITYNGTTDFSYSSGPSQISYCNVYKNGVLTDSNSPASKTFSSYGPLTANTTVGVQCFNIWGNASVMTNATITVGDPPTVNINATPGP